MQADLCQRTILVQWLQGDCLDLLAEEVVTEAYLVDAFVVFKRFNDADEARIVQSAWAEVEFLESGGAVAFACYYSGKDFDNLVP